MGKSCCVTGCNVSSPDVEYYKFPVRGALLTAWVAATGAPGGDVCSAHFTDLDYKSVRGRRRLLHTAVPSLLCKPASTENGEISFLNTDTTIKVNKKTVKAKPKNKKAKEKDKKSLETKSEDTDTNKEIPAEETDRNKVPEEEANETIEKSKVATENNDTTEKAQSDRESSQDSVDTRQSNGEDKIEGNGKEENAENAQPEVNDIEDMITNYQIKQTKPLADRLNPEPLEDLIPAILARASETPIQNTSQQQPQNTSEQPGTQDRVDVGQLVSHLSDKLDDHLAQMQSVAPVFIEVAVDQDTTRAESPQDCLMLLESVQCDIDPSSLMLPEHGPETDSDMEIVETDPDPKKEDSRKEDPISLLTSSDEDEVIIEEPHIDTVEVSDETDEDDKPLTTLIKAAKPKAKKKKEIYELGYNDPYHCAQCEFKTEDVEELKQHNLELGHVNSTTIHVCSVCNYSTASKAQFSRHKRKHKDERNFKCHLCNYKARHNMSLIYHLKCHAPEKEKKKNEKFTCDKCGFSSNVKSEALNHLKLKSCDGNRYACDECTYSTKRKSDLRRHMARRHLEDDSDEDYIA